MNFLLLISDFNIKSVRVHRVELRNTYIKFHRNRLSCYTDGKQGEADRRIFAAFYCEHTKKKNNEETLT